MKKIIIFGILLLLMCPCLVDAKTLDDYYRELANLQTEYNNNKNKTNLTEKQIAELNNEIDNISATIETTRKEIKQAELDIEQSKEDIEDKKVETDGLIQFLQISNGGNVYLEYLFAADSYTDFIYRYEVVKQLTNYNSDLIDELEQLILDLQEKEANLEKKQVSLENDRKELSGKLNTLQYSLTTYQVEGSDIKEDIESLEKLIKVYVDRGCSRYQDVSTCTAMINADGWKYPIAKGCVTSEYVSDKDRDDVSWGGRHYAIDLGCTYEGAPIYPAADGVVSKIVYRSDCGGNMVYIQHIVNGKKYTTNYMHLLKFGTDMYVGKVVTTNTIIGYVGGYSTSTKRGGYDGCTTGAHLHFGMAEGHCTAGYVFNSHSFNPREIFAFPKHISYGGGYFYR